MIIQLDILIAALIFEVLWHIVVGSQHEIALVILFLLTNIVTVWVGKMMPHNIKKQRSK